MTVKPVAGSSAPHVSELLSPKAAGALLHITSLPGRYGIGELGGAAFAFIDTLRAMQMSVWQFLPTGPTAYGDSPYQALSAFAGNELMIDVQALINDGLLPEAEAAGLTALPQHAVDYPALIPMKNALLAEVARRFQSRARSAEFAAFEQFMHTENDKWLHDYALFRLLKSNHEQRAWAEWEPHYAQRDDATLRKFETDHAAELLQIKTLQFLFRRQWEAVQAYARECNVRLFGDMPIYLASDSAEAWSRPDLLCVGRDGRSQEVAGVPPDYFSATGQLWGNPLYDWPAHKRDGYAWWIERLRDASERVDLVRIDHFRGFESFWAVPAAAKTAVEGRWVSGPGDALFAAATAELGDLPIVAEDLGLITPEVVALRKRQGIPGMQVLQFALMENGFAIGQIQPDCVCYTGTHDNDTTQGWFGGGGGDVRDAKEIRKTQLIVLEHTAGSPATVHLDLLRLACASEAGLAMAPVQDLLGLGSGARLNTPGTSQGNWRWRMSADQLNPRLREEIGNIVVTSGR